MFKKLKERWQLKTNWDVFVVLFIFSVTGSSTVLIRKPLFHLMGIDGDTSYWIKVPLYILIIFPSYQLLLLFFGFIFRQWEFVWNFEKKMLRRFGFKNLK